MIEIKNLTKKYGDLTVYENFSLQIEEGQTTCILGESGSGKTTLLNCIANLTDYEGQIPALKCAYVFQTPRLVPNLTVGGNLKLICKDDGAVDGILNRVHLHDKKNAYPKFLSGGQAQRASIARAFLYDGDVILLDEPFNSLDLKLKREISSLFSEIRQEKNATALFVTHDVDEALDVAQRIIIIKDGTIVCDVKTEGENKDELRKRLISALIA